MLKVSVISPEAVLFVGETDSVVAPAYDGEVGILTGHAPMMALLGNCERLRHKALQTACAADNELVLFGELVHTQNRNDVLELLVALKNALHGCRD